jgi:hypothetical protein
MRVQWRGISRTEPLLTSREYFTVRIWAGIETTYLGLIPRVEVNCVYWPHSNAEYLLHHVLQSHSAALFLPVSTIIHGAVRNFKVPNQQQLLADFKIIKARRSEVL